MFDLFFCKLWFYTADQFVFSWKIKRNIKKEKKRNASSHIAELKLLTFWVYFAHKYFIQAGYMKRCAYPFSYKAIQ